MKVDQTSRIILLIVIVVISYSILFLLLQPLFYRQPRTMFEMMQQMTNPSTQTFVPNILSLAIALVIGFFASTKLRPSKEVRVLQTDKQKVLKTIKKKLSQDEKKMLNEIERTGAITQDSLRARLSWSKAKASTILTRLDKMDLIQRERQGKTYKVFLSKDLK